MVCGHEVRAECEHVYTHTHTAACAGCWVGTFVFVVYLQAVRLEVEQLSIAHLQPPPARGGGGRTC